jgi:hypothetical protein
MRRTFGVRIPRLRRHLARGDGMGITREDIERSAFLGESWEETRNRLNAGKADTAAGRASASPEEDSDKARREERWAEHQRMVDEAKKKERGNVVAWRGSAAPPVENRERPLEPAQSQLTIPQANRVIIDNDRPVQIAGTKNVSIRKMDSSETEEEPSLLLLPGWHGDFRGIPNGMVRSALFAAIRPTQERRQFKNEPIASVDGLKILYTGEQLDQGDLDVFEGELHFALTHGIPLGKPVLHSDYSFLRSIGRGIGKKEYQRLRESQLRMAGGLIQIFYDHYSYAGSLISELYRDEKLKMTGPVFNPRLLVLFQPQGYSSVYWEHRLALKGYPLAQWLHSFYSTHKQPYAYSVAKIRELCGSASGKLYQFRYELKGALTKLSSITGWRCGIEGKDKIYVDRSGGIAEKILKQFDKKGAVNGKG